MRRTRARILASAIVLGTIAITTLAHGDLTITSNPTNADNAPVGHTVRAITSVRNTGSGARTITGISKHNPITPECLSSITASALVGGFPVTLQPNQQFQVLTTATFTSGDLMGLNPPGCLFDIDEMSGSGSATTFFVEFDNMGGGAWELQPHVMSFGMQSNTETQLAYAINHATVASSYAMAMITGDSTGSLRFGNTGCEGMTTCAGPGTIAAGGFHQLRIECTPTTTGTFTATLGLYAASVMLASAQLSCSNPPGMGSAHIDIVQGNIDLVGAQGAPTMTTFDVSFTGSAGSNYRMSNIDIFGGNGVFAFAPAPGCSGASCTFTPPARMLPTQMSVICTPNGNTEIATLLATGTGSAADTDMAVLQCMTGSGGGPTLQVAPDPVQMPSTAVNSPATPMPMTVTNGGGGTLTFQLDFGGSTEWSGNDCVASPCSLTGMGSNRTIAIGFTPSAWGPRNSSVAITNNGPTTPYIVDLEGSGSGATLEVTAPAGPAYEIDFGTIPRGAAPQRPLTFLATGNIGLMVNIPAPAAPFTANPSLVNLTPGIPGTTMIGCSSPTAGGPFVETISFSSTAYQATPTSITARCTIADTDLEVMPTTFDFGEVRVGSAPVELPITLRNPSTVAALVIHQMRLSSSTSGLSLDAPINTDVTLAPGETRSATMILDPTTEVDLAGRTLQISVDSSMLAFPITGKVVRASAYLVPSDGLDLGTACVGSSVTGQVIMVNDGTATLTMERPEMTNQFAAVYQDPTDYPAPLLAGRTAMIGVTPSASASGLLEGSLTWAVDAPDAPFSLPVKLEYILDGTAISPRRVPFGVVAVTERSERKTVRLENCGDVPVTLELGGVSARTGGTNAWDVQPDRGTIVLPPSGVQIINVEFAPLRRGSYAATIEIEIDNVSADVEIFGDATGPILEPTSFYACSCAGSTAPSRGWPVLLAFALVLRRRRRNGSSSAR